MNSITKINRTLESQDPKLTPRRREILESIRGQIELAPDRYPTSSQQQIIEGLYRHYGSSDAEKQVRELMGR